MVSRRALFVTVLATFAGLYFATQLQLAYPPSVRSSWGHAIATNLVFYWVWAAATPIIPRLARRFPLDQARVWRSLPIHVVLGALMTLAQLVVSQIIVGPFWGWKSSFAGGILVNFHSSYPTYFVILLGVTAWRSASLSARL